MFIQIQEGALTLHQKPLLLVAVASLSLLRAILEQGKRDLWRSWNLKDVCSQGLHPCTPGIIVGHKAYHAPREGLHPLHGKGEARVSGH